jgi:hypothetical protein
MKFIDRLIQHNGAFIAKALRELATWIEKLAPGPAVVATPVMFSMGGVRAMGEITVTTDDGPFTASVAYLDAKNNPTSPADTPVWESSDPNIVSVEASADGLNATLNSVSSGDGSGGAAAVVSVVAHDDDGEEVRSEGTVTVRPGDAVIGEVTFQAPSEAAPAEPSA